MPSVLCECDIIPRPVADGGGGGGSPIPTPKVDGPKLPLKLPPIAVGATGAGTVGGCNVGCINKPPPCVRKCALKLLEVAKTL